MRWVRWREDGGRMRSRTLPSKKEALAFDADVRTRRFRGEALPQPGRETLAAAYEEWWRLRGSTLAANTRRTHQAVWKAHVRGRFDHHRLASLAANPQLFEELTADMRARGVGPAAQRRVLMVLSAVLTACVQWTKIAVNPIGQVPKPPAARQRNPRPFPPAVVELICDEIRCRPAKDRDARRPVGDACFDRKFLQTIVTRVDAIDEIYKKILDDEDFRATLGEFYLRKIGRVTAPARRSTSATPGNDPLRIRVTDDG